MPSPGVRLRLRMRQMKRMMQLLLQPLTTPAIPQVVLLIGHLLMGDQTTEQPCR
jgi:hypothetical protein